MAGTPSLINPTCVSSWYLKTSRLLGLVHGPPFTLLGSSVGVYRGLSSTLGAGSAISPLGGDV